MKKILIVLTFSLCLVFNVQAQEEKANKSLVNKLSFGVKVGPTFTTRSSGSAGTDNGNKSGGRNKNSFHFGAIGELKLSNKFSFQTELLYLNEKSQTQKKDEQYSASYIQIPLLIKYYFSKKFSIEAGPQIAVLLSSDISKEQSFFDIVIVDELKKTDFRVAAGLSYKFGKRIFIGGRYELHLTEPKKIDVTDEDGVYYPLSHSKFRSGIVSAYLGYSF